MNKLPNLFLSAGAMKTGTTWLYANLKNHPDIYFTPEKEIHYFANKAGIENQLSHRNRILKFKAFTKKYIDKNPKELSKHLPNIYWYAGYARTPNINDNWYKSLFSLRGRKKKFCTDFSNLYCQMPSSSWKEVYNIADNLKVIYTLRDPLDRIWSHYKFHMKWIGREKDVLKAGFPLFKKTIDQRWFWVNAEYDKNYVNMRDGLRDEDFGLLYFEDFRKKPRAELFTLFEFLGIKKVHPDDKKIFMKINSTEELEFPKEWKEYAAEKLVPVEKRCKELGIWHKSWQSV